MNTPRFTAEASIDKTGSFYEGARSFDVTSRNAEMLTPQILDMSCFNDCIALGLGSRLQCADWCRIDDLM
jgi:hypothetical protein